MSYRSDIEYWRGLFEGYKDSLDDLYRRLNDVRADIDGLYEHMRTPGLSRAERDRCRSEIESLKQVRGELSFQIANEKAEKDAAWEQIQFYRQYQRR